MNMSETRQFQQSGLRGELRYAEPMKRHTSWRTGGLAQRMYQPADLADLQLFLQQLPPDEVLTVVGLGSNLLVRDGGLRGTVLLLHGALTALCQKDRQSIEVEAGVAGAKIARFAALHQLRGAEFCAGIPGTLGGMLAMNAGCYGSEIWQKVAQVQVLTRQGELIARSPQEYEIGYRHVMKRDVDVMNVQEFFISATLDLTPGDGEESRQEIKALLQKRIASQPLQSPNAGSVFRNPIGDFAARLIESCGLKGFRLGGAQVSEKHANFIINTGTATAADIENLIEHVRASVGEQTGIDLHPEVKIIGERAQHE
jgi:UDP-N-acetylmuramate dehydrogenase